jgi:hypothetical protein
MCVCVCVCVCVCLSHLVQPFLVGGKGEAVKQVLRVGDVDARLKVEPVQLLEMRREGSSHGWVHSRCTPSLEYLLLCRQSASR